MPRGTYATVNDSLGAFRRLREEMMQFIKTTEEHLRGRQYLTASQDLYQWLLMISTHAQRHILQIREVRAHKDFPKQ